MFSSEGPVRNGLLLLTLGLIVVVSLGCESRSSLVSLMPTPVLYKELGIGPLDKAPEAERWAPRQVFYLTTRERASDFQRIEYGNRASHTARMGFMLIGFGTEELDWEELRKLSANPDRAGKQVPLTVAGIVEMGRWRMGSGPDPGALSIPLSMIDDSIIRARDNDLLIYVHGAKVNFYNAGAFAAELDLFTRRDMTVMTFAWPTHQNIFSYAIGQDVRRAYNSAQALADLLVLVAEQTSARNVHIVSWSAGGRVVTAALQLLHQRYPDRSTAQWARQLRLGTLYYAAADVPRGDFFDSLDAQELMAERIIVSVTDNDGALKSARRFMGGDYRVGDRKGDLLPGQLQRLKNTNKLEVIDVSMGAEERGFDISGHRYWFDHPWASTDVLLAVRSDLEPQDRGLERSDLGFLWYMPSDYPQRLRESMLRPDLEMRRMSTKSEGRIDE